VAGIAAIHNALGDVDAAAGDVAELEVLSVAENSAVTVPATVVVPAGATLAITSLGATLSPTFTLGAEVFP